MYMMIRWTYGVATDCGDEGLNPIQAIKISYCIIVVTSPLTVIASSDVPCMYQRVLG